MQNFSIDMRVSFGDCDPAGIVYYPNFFIWIDRVFHALLRENLGGHARACKELGAQGFGAMNTEMSFRSPALEGDLVSVQITGITWSGKSYSIDYQAHIGPRLVFEAVEVRGVFIRRDGRMRAGDVTPLKERLQQAGCL